MNFRVSLLSHWIRLGDDKQIAEDRPHVVPITEVAHDYMRWSVQAQYTPEREALYGWTDSFSVLKGLRLEDTFGFRFKSLSADQVETALRLAEEALVKFKVKFGITDAHPVS